MRRLKTQMAASTIVFIVLLASSLALAPDATHDQKTGWVGAPGPNQPVAFYHEVHVNELRIPCAYCHWTAATSRDANIPPLETCWGCHKDISITHPEIAKVRRYYLTSQPIAWVRINRQPDYVHFSHAVHVGSNIACATCHGEVGKMYVVYQPREMNMGWCLTCHRTNEHRFRPKKAATDCYTCHY